MTQDVPSSRTEKITERLSAQSSRFPGKMFLFDLPSGRRFTFREFDGLVSRTGGYLESLGVGKGDLVSAVLDNGPELCLFFFAALRIGAIFNPYPAVFIAADVGRDLEPLAPKVLILPGERRGEFGPLEVGKAFIEARARNGFIDGLGAFAPESREAPARPEDIAFIYHSAGRLIDPRGVRYSHGNLASLIPSVARGLNLRGDDVHLIVLPLAHTAALNYSLFPCAWLGATAVLADGFWNIRDRFWRVAAEFDVSYTQVVPTVLHVLLHQRGGGSAGAAPTVSRLRLRAPFSDAPHGV